ncbi:ankyrin repeat-containing domain protein, partial [Baffinella frigidus]
TPLLVAAHQGHVDVVRVLLAHGADASTKDKCLSTPLHSVAIMGHEALKLTGHDHEEVAKVLLLYTPDVSAKDIAGTTPLHCAALMGHEGQVALLLAHNAEVSA